MPAVFEYFHTVGNDEIDEQGHANNVAYIAWLQAAAVAHSDAQGWPGRRYRDLGAGWVVRSHAIKYLQPSYAGEGLVVQTWVATLKRVTSLRRYRVLRVSDQRLLAEAETDWAFVDYATARPRHIPVEVSRAFEVLDR